MVPVIMDPAQLALPLTSAAVSASGIRRLRDRVGLRIGNLKQVTEVIVRNHYLHRGRTMAQMPYWITLDDEPVGVLLYAYPRMSARFCGHGPMNMLELARMWLEPKVQGLQVVDSEGKGHSFSVATCAVGMSLRQVRADWAAKYPHLPAVEAVVSWADQVHHEGTIYRAANFREVGTSGGSYHGSTVRRNGGRDQLNEDYLHLKTAFIHEYRKPLRSGRAQTRERMSGDDLPQVQGGRLLQADAVGLDIVPADLWVVDGQATGTEGT